MHGRDLSDRAAVSAWVLVGAGVAGVSFSGPIAAAVAVPALAVAFWRTALGALATAPVVVAQRGRGRCPTGTGWTATAVAGVLLAVHFGTWIPSLRLTSVATSTALVTSSPLWIVLVRLLRRERVRAGTGAGALLGVAGVALITGLDVHGCSDALAGDALALLGGAAGAGYTLAGERARLTASTAGYTLGAYAVCALALVPACLAFRVPFAGWDGAAWLQVLVLTAVAQLLGHTAFNAALPAVGAASLSLAILLEVPGATLVAWLWLGQPPPAGALPGVAAVLAGLVLVVRAESAAR